MKATTQILAHAALAACAALFPVLSPAAEPAPHRDMIGCKRAIAMENFLRTDPGLKLLGTFRTRTSKEIAASNWSIGCETLDRDYADFDEYKDFVAQTGAKRGRLFSGWAKTEQQKGVYDFAWLDAQVHHLATNGVKPWICLSYGNPVYNSGINLGAGVAGVVKNPEGYAAWLKYCGEVVRRYKDVVDEWEVWNEPFGKQMDEYADMVVRTSDVVRREQPRAKVMVSAVGSVSNAELLLANLAKAGRLDAVQAWHTHPYMPNPDNARDAWWGINATAAFRAKLQAAIPGCALVQGETGCPGQLEYGHAICMRPWTEYSQAKWDLRSMAVHAVRGIPYSVFTMVDLQYKDYMLQSFGLLRMNLGKKVMYARPKFHACRNMFSFFDSEVKPVGPVDASFKVLEARIPQVDLPSCDPPKTYPVPYRVSVARFEKGGSPVLLAWYAHRIPADALVFDTVELSVPGVSFRDPVWMDMITGRVYELPASSFETKDGATVFKTLPLWDSPVLLAERPQVPLASGR